VRLRVTILLALIWTASAAMAECRPEGRDVFAAGLAALARRDLPAARQAFAELVRSQPACAEARNNLAVVEAEEGRVEEAAEQLRQALQLEAEYARARANLQRVEALLIRQQTNPVASPTTTAIPVSAVSGTPTQPPAQATAAALPFGIAAIEPQGTNAVALDLAGERICVLAAAEAVAEGQSGSAGILPAAISSRVVTGQCYPIVAAQVRAWPRWLMTAVVEPQRIRLVDETGERRLKIAPDHVIVLGDVVYLRRDDFTALRAQTAPWRTSWVVHQPGTDVAEGNAAEQVRQAIQVWQAAWQEKRYGDYMSSYSAAFVPHKVELAAWRVRKRSLFEHSGLIFVRIGNPSIFILDAATVITIFEQWYRADANAFHELKALRWQRQEGQWKISVETVLTALPPQ